MGLKTVLVFSIIRLFLMIFIICIIQKIDKIKGKGKIKVGFNKEVKMIEEHEIGDKMRIQSDKIYRGGVL